MCLDEYHKLGFCIIGREVQRIDDPREWAAENEARFIPPLLPNDDVAKELAIKEGFEFNDPDNFYLVTKFPESQ